MGGNTIRLFNKSIVYERCAWMYVCIVFISKLYVIELKKAEVEMSVFCIHLCCLILQGSLQYLSIQDPWISESMGSDPMNLDHPEQGTPVSFVPLRILHPRWPPLWPPMLRPFQTALAEVKSLWLQSYWFQVLPPTKKERPETPFPKCPIPKEPGLTWWYEIRRIFKRTLK